jgi:hypothetical protein
MTRAFEPREDPDIDSVWRWFEFQMGLLREERERILRIDTLGSGIDLGSLRAHELPLTGFTRGEVEEFFDEQTGHLELLTMLELLATTEAILRIDFKARVRERRKDDLSRRFREAHKLRGDKIRLDGDILAALKEAGVGVGEFRGTLKLRDWLAHGRHWHPKLGMGYTPDLVLGVARGLVDSIPP